MKARTKILNLEVHFDSDLGNKFEVNEIDYPHIVLMSFDEIEQLYTWAASIHERDED